MAVIKCKMCGGDLVIQPGSTICECEYCGSKQTIPNTDDEKRLKLYERANKLRFNCEFDKAAGVYESIVAEFQDEAEAYWGLILCKYGIEYVDDPATGKKIPTCHRSSFDCVLDDNNFELVMENADAISRAVYRDEAKQIEELRKGIVEVSSKEEPYDIFICYKETADDGQRTIDSVIAQDVYDELIELGYRVFFSRVTLEDKLGQEYEPYIFAALNSAKVMLAFGTQYEYYNAVWVKNEWSRFLQLMEAGQKKILIPCYKGIDAYDMPKEFAKLQAQDMGKVGAIQDLVRGIKKIIPKSEENSVIRQVVASTGKESIEPLLKRAFMFLEDGEFAEAGEYCERVLDQDPENSQAYLGKLMAELRVRRQEDLPNCEQPFNNNNNYQKAMRFGGEKFAGVLSGYIDHINERNENTRLAGIYNNAVTAMKSASSETSFKSAAASFKTIPGFKDADSLAEQCFKSAEICRKDAVYASAMSQLTGNTVCGYEAAMKTFSTISGWKDADEQIYACQRKIEEIKAKEEADRLERERQDEERHIATEKAAKKRKRIFAIATPIIVACIAFVILLTTIIIPYCKYIAAIKLYNVGEYEDAMAALTALDGYKDSAVWIEKCETAMKDEKYTVAVDLYNVGKYKDAITAFAALDGYKDSTAQIEKCETAIKDEKYTTAVDLYNAGKYYEAIMAFKGLNRYKDSTAQIEKCEIAIKDERYNAAVDLFNEGKLDEAITAFKGLNGYKNSVEKIDEIKPKYYMQLLSEASVGSTVFLGSYEQDNNASNGKEDVEWIVLARENNRVLVISRYALDCEQYNTSENDITWETCFLRKWLNEVFLNAAFSEEERAMIPSVTVNADKNPDFSTSPGNSTTDQVFLLSITEANMYFDWNSDRQCQGTAYCYSQTALKGGDGNCWWWLRSPGRDSAHAATVDSDGSVNKGGYSVNRMYDAVRPAMYIDIGS